MFAAARWDAEKQTPQNNRAKQQRKAALRWFKVCIEKDEEVTEMFLNRYVELLTELNECVRSPQWHCPHVNIVWAMRACASTNYLESNGGSIIVLECRNCADFRAQ